MEMDVRGIAEATRGAQKATATVAGLVFFASLGVNGQFAQWLLSLAVGALTGGLLLGSLELELAQLLSETATKKRQEQFVAFLALVKYPIFGLLLVPFFSIGLVDSATFAVGFIAAQVALIAKVISRMAAG